MLGLDGVHALTVAARRSCALRDDGSVWCWGVDYDGRPVPRLGRSVLWRRRAWSPVPVRVQGVPAASALADGCAADIAGPLCVLARDGDVWCVDQSVTAHHGAPTGVPERLAGLHAAVQIAVGATHGCARTRAGELWCWGGDSFGQLGRGRFESGTSFPPSRVPLPPARQVAAGWDTSCALLEDGSVRCWGSNLFGQVGDGGSEHANRPVVVRGLPPAVELAMTHDHVCARTEPGEVWCWGGNSTQHPGAPVRVGQAPTALALALAPGLTCALGRDGSVSCLGQHDLQGEPVATASFELVPGLRGEALAVGAHGSLGPTGTRACVLNQGHVRCLGGTGAAGED